MAKLIILTISILFSSYTLSFSRNYANENTVTENLSSLYKLNKIVFIRCVWPPCDDEI